MRTDVAKKIDAVFNVLHENFIITDVQFKVETCLNFVNYFNAKGIILFSEKFEAIEYIQNIFIRRYNSDYYRQIEIDLGFGFSNCDAIRSVISELRSETEYDYEYYISPVLKFLKN